MNLLEIWARTRHPPQPQFAQQCQRSRLIKSRLVVEDGSRDGDALDGNEGTVEIPG
jgi:hypothetical protein